MPAASSRSGPQVPLHHVRLGDRVGDRGGGGEGDHPAAVAAAQVADLHVQVGGAHRPVDRGVADVGRGAQVLVPVGLVDAQVVDAGGLEGDARVLGGVELGLEPFLGAQQRSLQPLDRAAGRRSLAACDPVPHLGQLAVHVGLLLGGAERDALERRPGHDDAVPGAGGAAGDELAAPVPLQVLLPGDQHPGLRVQLQPFAGELLEHVVRDDDGGLADQAEAPQLGDAHDHFGGFPGADLVGQQDGGLADHPGDGGDLVRPGPERQRQAGQRQLGVVVAAQHQAVEPVVVGAGQRRRRGPGPPRPSRRTARPARRPSPARPGSRPRSAPTALPVRRRSPCRGPGWCAVRARPGRAAAPGSGWCPRWRGEHGALVAADRPDLAAGMLDLQARVIEHLPQELPDIARRRSRPRRAARRSPRASGRPGSPGAVRRR